jgi:hypothetical protein
LARSAELIKAVASDATQNKSATQTPSRACKNEITELAGENNVRSERDQLLYESSQHEQRAAVVEDLTHGNSSVRQDSLIVVASA